MHLGYLAPQTILRLRQPDSAADSRTTSSRSVRASDSRRLGAVAIQAVCENHVMLSRAFNTRQRVVVIIGFGAGLYLFGSWLTSRGEVEFGWVAYAPLSNAVNTADFPGGLHPWARLLIWLALILIWVGTSVILLRSRASGDASERAD
jgi:hypothetical protein